MTVKTFWYICSRGSAWLARSAERANLGLRVVSTSPMLGVEITLKNTMLKKFVNVIRASKLCQKKVHVI